MQPDTGAEQCKTAGIVHTENFFHPQATPPSDTTPFGAQVKTALQFGRDIR